MGGEKEPEYKPDAFQDVDSLSIAEDDTWIKAVCKGTWLLVQMSSPLDDSFESPYQSFSGRADLEKWGYKRHKPEPTTYNDKTSNITGQILLKPTTFKDCHEYGVIVDGKVYPATNAIFHNAYYPTKGMVKAKDNSGPWFMVDEYDEDRYPMLKHWSDVVYLQWSEACEPCDDPLDLRYIVRSAIENGPTSRIINRILAAEDKPLAKWPGVTYRMDTENGKALLGCQIGLGVGYLLSQHKRGLGHKTVREVRVYHDYVLTRLVPTLIFYLQDVVLDDAEDAECQDWRECIGGERSW